MDVLMNQLRQRLVWKENPDEGPGYIPTGDTFGETTIEDFVSPDRQLSLRVLMSKAIYPTSGSPYYEYTEFDNSEIVSYSIDEQCGSPGFQIGGTIAASFSLSIDNTTRHYQSADFVDTRFAVAIGVQAPGQTNVDYEPFGVFWTSDANTSEQATTVDITGLDALGVEYNTTFWPFSGDEGSLQIAFSSVLELIDYTYKIASDVNLGTIIDENGNVASAPADYSLFSYKFTQPTTRTTTDHITGFYNTLHSEPSQMMYVVCNGGGVTYRQMIGWIALTFGCFAAMGRDGDLEFRGYDRTVYDGFAGAAYTFTPSIYFDYFPQGATEFKFNELVSKYYPSLDSAVTDTYRERVSFGYDSSVYNMLELAASPLANTTSLHAIFHVFMWSIRQLECEGMSLSVVGAPQFVTGQYYCVQDLNEASHYMVLNSMSTTYDGGLTMTLTCSLPSDATLYSASYNATTSLTRQLETSTYGNIQYQTDEVITGSRWLNGQPIYRKTFSGTTDSTGGVVVGELSHAPDVVVTIKGTYSINGLWRSVPFAAYSNIAWSTYASVDSTGDVRLQLGSSNTGTKQYFIIVEYTRAQEGS